MLAIGGGLQANKGFVALLLLLLLRLHRPAVAGVVLLSCCGTDWAGRRCLEGRRAGGCGTADNPLPLCSGGGGGVCEPPQAPFAQFPKRSSLPEQERTSERANTVVAVASLPAWLLLQCASLCPRPCQCPVVGSKHWQSCPSVYSFVAPPTLQPRRRRRRPRDWRSQLQGRRLAQSDFGDGAGVTAG